MEEVLAMNTDHARSGWLCGVAIVLAIVAIVLAAVAMRGKAPSMGPVGINVSGHSDRMADPDTAYVSLAVVTRDKSPKQAAEMNARAAQAVTNAVTAIGIAKKDIQTQGYSLQPWINYTKRGGEKQLGYVARNTVGVTVRDIKKVGDVMDAGTRAGANSVEGLSFAIGDDAKVRREVLAAAVENAREKAQAVAKAAGVKLGAPVSIEESGGYLGPMGPAMEAPVASRAKGQAYPKTPVAPGQLEVTCNVDTTFAIGR
jgi:hypothetical protein